MSAEKNKKALSLAFALGMELLTLVLAALFLGFYIGGYFMQKEIGAILGTGVGFTLWFWRLYKTKRYLL